MPHSQCVTSMLIISCKPAQILQAVFKVFTNPLLKYINDPTFIHNICKCVIFCVSTTQSIMVCDNNLQTTPSK